jgi:hypothetical protein
MPPQRWSASRLPGRPDLVVRLKPPQSGSAAIMAAAGVSSATQTTSTVLPLSGWPACELVDEEPDARIRIAGIRIARIGIARIRVPVSVIAGTPRLGSSTVC